MDRESLIEIVSGERRGIFAFCIRLVLGTLSLGYRLVIGIRNRRFDSGKSVTQVEIPVISIGNLTTGGTGKSPMVIWLANFLRQNQWRVAVLSRGYGAKEFQTSDEALELEQRLLDVPHLQNPDRVASARIAIDELEMQVLVLDDAFQHRKIARDLDVVMIDCTRPFGFGHLLPRGLLREPLSSLKRADLIVLSRCDQVIPQELADIENRLQSHCSCPIIHIRGRASHLLQADGQTATIESIRSEPVYAFCGIGNHENFWKTLDDLNFRVEGKMPFPDHHDYDREDIQKIGVAASRAGAGSIICTHKDLVKIGVNQLNGVRIYALVVDVEFLSGESELSNAVLNSLPSTSNTENSD